MVRRALLAALICVATWAIVDRSAIAVPQGIGAGAGSSCHTADSASTDPGSGRQWNASDRRAASLTESVWRSQLHHAELAGVSTVPARVAEHRSGSRVRRDHRPARHLHTIPLLI